MKKFIGVFLSLLFMVMGLGSVYAFEKMKDNINTEEVIVLTQDVEFKEKLTEKHFGIKKIPVEHIVEGAVREKDLNSIIGGYASIDLPKGFQITKEFVDYHDLVPDESNGEFIAPIPSEWLFAVPGTLRRSYIADFYTVSADNQYQDRLRKLIESEELDDVSDLKNIDFTEKVQKEVGVEPLLKNVRVAHVRDRNNQEIVSQTEDGVEGATGTIASLEIIANEDVFSALQNAVNKGERLYVVYRFERNEIKEEAEVVQESSNEEKTKEEDE